jgi:hypothetical protein
MNETRRQRLQALENKIAETVKARHEAALKLKEIRDDELCKEDGFKTWKSYIRERFGWTPKQVDRLTAEAEAWLRLPRDDRQYRRRRQGEADRPPCRATSLLRPAPRSRRSTLARHWGAFGTSVAGHTASTTNSSSARWRMTGMSRGGSSGHSGDRAAGNWVALPPFAFLSPLRGIRQPSVSTAIRERRRQRARD